MMKSLQEYLEERIVQEMRSSEERLCSMMTDEAAKKILDEGLERGLKEECEHVLRIQK